jgi:hypothetical protein
MEGERRRRRRLRSFALGGVVGAAGTIATVRRMRRSRVVRAATGLAAFEDAPCFLEGRSAVNETHDAKQ